MGGNHCHFRGLENGKKWINKSCFEGPEGAALDFILQELIVTGPLAAAYADSSFQRNDPQPRRGGF